jgi:hypothetical protein
MSDNWLENLKPGDEVCADRSRIVKIAKVTKLHVITEGGSKWGKRGGYLVGSTGWDRSWIRELTPELREQINVDLARESIERIKWKEQPCELILAVATLITRGRK